MKHTDSCQRGGGLRGWMEEGEGMKQKKICTEHIDLEKCGDSQRERAWGR